MSETSDRALKFAKYKGCKAAEFERISGLSNGMLKNLSDKTRRSTFDRISNAFPELNIEWLRTGEGEMLKPVNTHIKKRTIGKVTSNSAATHGDQSPIIKDVKIDVEEDVTDAEFGVTPKDILKYRNEIKKLNKHLSDAKNEISRLEGRIEEKENFIKLLLEKR